MIAIQLLCSESFETIRPIMQISARNILKGRVTKLVEGAVNCEVTLEIAPGVEIVSIITKASARRSAWRKARLLPQSSRHPA